MEENKIPEMKSQLELIKKQSTEGKKYWTVRDLCEAIGYTTDYRFTSVIKKAIAITQTKVIDVNDHFYFTVEMTKLNSETYENIKNFHLSRTACLIISPKNIETTSLYRFQKPS